MRTNRRVALKLLGGAVTALSFPNVASAQPKKVRVGWNPLAGGGAAITMVMVRDKLFERAARDLGEDIEIDWKTFAAAPPATEALAAGLLDIELHSSSLSIVNRIASGLPASPIAVVGSHLSNAIMVPVNSPIEDVAQLKGKRIGLPVGTSAHYLLASVVRMHFGQSVEQAGIRIVNMPAADAMKMPSGIDASVVWIPLRFIAPKLGLARTLVDGDGRYGDATKHVGQLSPEVKQSWAYPEGYNADRVYASAHNSFISSNPNLIVAFLRAQIEAQNRALSDQDALVAFVADRWKQDPDIVRITLQTSPEAVGIRRAPYLLESDALSIAKASEFLHSIGAREKPLSMADVTMVFANGGAQQRAAWQKDPAPADPSEWERGFSGKTDLYGEFHVAGGKPIWTAGAIPNWGERIYRAGPF